MKNFRLLPFAILLLYCGVSNTTFAQQDFTKYHAGFIEVESQIVEEDFVQAERLLRPLLIQFDSPFVKDWLIAAQLSALNNQESFVEVYLKKALKKGLGWACIEKMVVFEDYRSSEWWKNLQRTEGELGKVERKNIDLLLAETFHKNYVSEQASKKTEQYSTIVNANFDLIQSLMDSVGFPGEKLVGIDKSIWAEAVDDCGCGNAKVIVTLLHIDYPIARLGIDKFQEAIKQGQLHPREFASIYSFEQMRQSKLYDNSKFTFKALSNYFLNFPFGLRSEDLERVDRDRNNLGICSIDVDEAIREVERDYEIRLRFNYK